LYAASADRWCEAPRPHSIARSSRRRAGENPIQWTDKVPQTARVVALTGTADTFTSP
jgi:hypothetical protein